jgi:hypothetical protein
VLDRVLLNPVNSSQDRTSHQMLTTNCKTRKRTPMSSAHEPDKTFRIKAAASEQSEVYNCLGKTEHTSMHAYPYCQRAEQQAGTKDQRDQVLQMQASSRQQSSIKLLPWRAADAPACCTAEYPRRVGHTGGLREASTVAVEP